MSIKTMIEDNKNFAIGAVFVVLIAALIILSACVISVPAGHKGVAVAGFDVGMQFDEGWQFKNPLTQVEYVRYNTQITEESISARSADGYNVEIDFAIRYHLSENRVGDIRVENPDYEQTVIISILRSQVRTTVSDWNMTGEQMNLERSAYEAEVEARVIQALTEYYVIVEEVMIRNLDFPATVTVAWESRVAAEIDVQTATFELLAAEQRALQLLKIAQAESNSTVVLAEGQAEALRILAAESDNLDNSTIDYILSLKYIEALRDPESNVEYVILTDGDNPFILDMGTLGEETP
ncbi:MAG: prohibitin family protein [Thermoplasmata archaeon]|nr:prohibitin family protein [Thermoplasmata archaeon]